MRLLDLQRRMVSVLLPDYDDGDRDYLVQDLLPVLQNLVLLVKGKKMDLA